jgi:hypothetical protein
MSKIPPQKLEFSAANLPKNRKNGENGESNFVILSII